MTTGALLQLLSAELEKLQQAGLYRQEVVFPPTDRGYVTGSDAAVDMTGYDYLGLGSDPALREAAVAAMETYGHGLGSSRAFSGTRQAHTRLERAVAEFLDLPDAIVYSSGYAANLGLFDTLFDSRDAIFCDAWAHPSVAEGVRLSGARGVPYANNDVEYLEDQLKRSGWARFRTIVTDGVFPFTGEVARLHLICELAERYEAMVVVDDCLGVGVLGERGRGAREVAGVMDQVHLITGTFGKALGAAGGGFVAGSREVVQWLRQKSTPYLFSGALPPAMVGVATAAVERLATGKAPLKGLWRRVTQVRDGLLNAGFRVMGQEHPNLTVFVGDAVTLQKMVNRLFKDGIRVHGLCYPVVPEREARIRLQISVNHSTQQLNRVVASFREIGQSLAVV